MLFSKYYNISLLICMFDLYIITILPTIFYKHIMPGHVHDTNITIIHDISLTYFVMALTPIRRPPHIICSILLHTIPLMVVLIFCKCGTSHKLHFTHHVIV
jgi:hypothetical protein